MVDDDDDEGICDIHHVMPRNDLIEHLADEEGACICGPRCEIVIVEGQPDLHRYVHASLDGRELRERRPPGCQADRA